MRTPRYLGALVLVAVFVSPVLAGYTVPADEPMAFLPVPTARPSASSAVVRWLEPDAPRGMGVRPVPSMSVRSAIDIRPVAEFPANPPRVVPRSPEPRNAVAGSHRLLGTASYYCTPAHPICHHAYPVGSMVAAACGKLRNAIGPNWRGKVVTVRAGSRSIRVALVDWCGSSSKTIDLYGRPFSMLAPLSRGVVAVQVSW